MSKLRSLLYKEWRDQRALVFGAVVLLALLLAFAKMLAGKRFDPVLREEYIYPASLAVFAVMIATEVIARDASSGVERTLLRVPAARALAWLAKAGFAILASIGCLLFLMLAEQILRQFEASTLALRPTLLRPMHLSLVACAASACLVAACVLKRSLPAVFAGLALVELSLLLAWWMPATRAKSMLDLCFNSWSRAEFAFLATVAFLLGSLLAFAVRRAGAFGLRRSGAAALGTGVVLVPVLGVTAWNSAWALDIAPFSPRAKIWRAEPSPDGRFLAVQAEQTWTTREDWFPLTGQGTGSRCRVRHEVWLLELATGRWNELDDRNRMMGDSPAWDPSGRLVAISMPGSFGDGEWVFERIDPRTLSIERTHVPDLSEALGHWCSKTQQGQDWVLRWRSKHVQLRLPGNAIVAAAPQAGIVFHDQNGFLVRHELDPDGTTALLPLGGEGQSRMLQVSPDGSLLFLPNDRRIVDACDGHVVRQFDPYSNWCGWSRIPGRICTVWHTGDEFTALNEDGTETPMPARGFDYHHLGLDAPAPIGGSEELGCDRFLLWDQQRIECMKLDGSEREVLYQARP